MNGQKLATNQTAPVTTRRHPLICGRQRGLSARTKDTMKDWDLNCQTFIRRITRFFLWATGAPELANLFLFLILIRFPANKDLENGKIWSKLNIAVQVIFGFSWMADLRSEWTTCIDVYNNTTLSFVFVKWLLVEATFCTCAAGRDINDGNVNNISSED